MEKSSLFLVLRSFSMTRMWVLLTFVVVLAFGAIQVLAEPVRLHGLNYNTVRFFFFGGRQCIFVSELHGRHKLIFFYLPDREKVQILHGTNVNGKKKSS